jgi:hypothetical protein
LLDGLVVALRRLPTLELPRLPRMADFTRLACAAAPAFGWTEDDVLAALDANRADAVLTVIEGDAVAVAVQSLAAGVPFSGTATELLARLSGLTPTESQRAKGWPKDAARLSARLRRAAPALRRAGVDVRLPTGGGRSGRVIEIQPLGPERQRSERSERSNPAHSSTYRNAGGNQQRSGNGSMRHQRSANPLEIRGWNAGNAGNADSGVSARVWETEL